MQIADVGLVGLGVMGENLALNFESKGFAVSVYNRSHPDGENKVDRFLNCRGLGKRFVGTYTIPELVASVRKPRRIMLMIKAGNPVDEVLHDLIPCLEAGDVVIDGGNSDFHDTERRQKELESHGILFVGTGISGGEAGALNGPSIMPGGSPQAWPLVKNLLQEIAAKLSDGTPCCQWMGKGGAGHYVKMVHNGIEYGDMQLIAEMFFMLRKLRGLNNDEIARVFEQWNAGDLNSYLLDITVKILRFREKGNGYLLDHILDVAGQKGTGKWTVAAALDEGEPLSLITGAVLARFLSALPEERRRMAALYPLEVLLTKRPGETDSLMSTFYAVRLISYAQGFSLLRRASEHYGWELNFGTIATIWRNGCIIRSGFLQQIAEVYRNRPGLENLLFDDFFRDKVRRAVPGWRRVAADCALGGIPAPCMMAALSYFDGISCLSSPANLIQAQRDYFGAHTYERTDASRGKHFHMDWEGTGDETVTEIYNT